MITKDICGKFVTLRSATELDAEFALNIRRSPKAVKFMPPLNISVEQQTAWIKKQRELEGDYFFIAWNKFEKRVGVLGVYDVDSGKGGAEIGRIVMQGKPYESLESWLLLLEFSFENLKLNEVVAYVHPQNYRAIRFYKFFGGIIQENNQNVIRSFPFQEIHFNPENLCIHRPLVVKKIISSKELLIFECLSKI